MLITESIILGYIAKIITRCAERKATVKSADISEQKIVSLKHNKIVSSKYITC